MLLVLPGWILLVRVANERKPHEIGNLAPLESRARVVILGDAGVGTKRTSRPHASPFGPS